MPLEKQKKKKKTDERKNTQGQKRGEERERNCRLDSKEEEIDRCSHLLERYLCKMSGDKIINIQNCSWSQ